MAIAVIALAAALVGGGLVIGGQWFMGWQFSVRMPTEEDISEAIQASLAQSLEDSMGERDDEY